MVVERLVGALAQRAQLLRRCLRSIARKTGPHFGFVHDDAYASARSRASRAERVRVVAQGSFGAEDAAVRDERVFQRYIGRWAAVSQSGRSRGAGGADCAELDRASRSRAGASGPPVSQLRLTVATSTAGFTTFSGRSPRRKATTCRATRVRSSSVASVRVERHVRRHDHARIVPRRLRQVRRLGILHVERRPGEPARGQRLGQRRVIDQSAARRVDEKRRRLHAARASRG